MPLLVWNKNLALDIPSMDVQHQRWIDLINQLYESILQKEREDLVGQILKSMLDYTRTHFIDEEALLSENNYPDFVGHKQLHDSFIMRLQELEVRYQKGRQILTTEVMMFLSDWLSNHIKIADRQYASFLKEHGV